MKEREPKTDKELVKERRRLFMEEHTCWNEDYPKYNGRFCLCAGCRDIVYCVDVKCNPCDGPVKECNPIQDP